MVTEVDVVNEGWITTAEAAVLADYTTARVRQLAKTGRIGATKIGRDWRVNKADLLAYKAQVRPGRPRKQKASGNGAE